MPNILAIRLFEHKKSDLVHLPNGRLKENVFERISAHSNPKIKVTGSYNIK